MNKHGVALLVLVLGLCTAHGAEDTTLKNMLKGKVEELESALIAEDYGKVVDLTYPKVVEGMGGRKKMIAVMETGMKDMKSKGMSLRSVRVDSPSDPVNSGAERFAVVPYQLEMKVPAGRLLGRSFAIGISGDKGKTWTFVDGNADIKILKQALPNLPEQLKLPEKQKPVLEKGGDDRTRDFPAYKCRYTLPDDHWSWDDAPKDQLLKAHSNKGLAVVLGRLPAVGDARVDKKCADGFENGFYKVGAASKRGGRFITFLGQPCYQAEFTLSGKTGVTRVFLAHGSAFTLAVVGGKDPVEKDALFETAMNGFAFTEPPVQAPARSPSQATDVLSFRMGQIVGYCLLGAIAILALTRLSSKKKTQEQPASPTSRPPSTP